MQAVRRKKGPANRSRAEKTLMLLRRKEEELQYALMSSTDQVEQQRQVRQHDSTSSFPHGSGDRVGQ